MYLVKTPSEPSPIQAVVLYCSDGRYGTATERLLQRALSLPRYDRLVFPGGAGALGSHPAAWRDAEALLESLRFLVSEHGLRRVVLVAHDDCGFYSKRLGIPAAEAKDRQLADLRTAAGRIRSCGSVEVEAWYAEKAEDGIRFESVPL